MKADLIFRHFLKGSEAEYEKPNFFAEIRKGLFVTTVGKGNHHSPMLGMYVGRDINMCGKN